MNNEPSVQLKLYHWPEKKHLLLTELWELLLLVSVSV